MAKEKKLTLADAIPSEYCLTIDDLAEEFNLGTIRMRQIVDKALKEKIVQKLVKLEGRRILYTPQMVEQLKAARDAGKLGKFNKKSEGSSLKHAEIILQVAVFDHEIAELLKNKYHSNEKMSEFLKSTLENSVKPLLSKKREIQERYERELNDLLTGPVLDI